MGSAINYPRHFAFLVIAVAVLLVVEPTSFTPWPDRFTFFFALFGALHATALVMALRAGPIWRRLTFIPITAVLSAIVPYLGLAVPRALGLDGGFSLVGAMTVGSAAGACAYWMLVRAFWIPTLEASDWVRTLAFCVAATPLGMMLATVLSGFGAHHSVLGDIVPTALWWFAFSYSLWRSERPAMAANNRWRGP
jgi:hypothetical protein